MFTVVLNAVGIGINDKFSTVGNSVVEFLITVFVDDETGIISVNGDLQVIDIVGKGVFNVTEFAAVNAHAHGVDLTAEIDDTVLNLDDFAVNGIKAVTLCIDRFGNVGNAVSACFQRACSTLFTVVEFGNGHFTVSGDFNQTLIDNSFKRGAVSGDLECGSVIDIDRTAEISSTVNGQSSADVDLSGIGGGVFAADDSINVEIESSGIGKSVPGNICIHVERSCIADRSKNSIDRIESTAVVNVSGESGAVGINRTAVGNRTVEGGTVGIDRTAVGNAASEHGIFCFKSSGIADFGVERSGNNGKDRILFGTHGESVNSGGGAVNLSERKRCTALDRNISAVVGEFRNIHVNSDSLGADLNDEVGGAAVGKSPENLFSGTVVCIGDTLA